MLMYSFSDNFAILDSTSMPMCSFAVNFDILDLTLYVDAHVQFCS